VSVAAIILTVLLFLVHLIGAGFRAVGIKMGQMLRVHNAYSLNAAMRHLQTVPKIRR